MPQTGREMLGKGVLSKQKEKGSISDAFHTNEFSSLSPIWGLALSVHHLESKYH